MFRKTQCFLSTLYPVLSTILFSVITQDSGSTILLTSMNIEGSTILLNLVFFYELRIRDRCLAVYLIVSIYILDWCFEWVANVFGRPGHTKGNLRLCEHKLYLTVWREVCNRSEPIKVCALSEICCVKIRYCPKCMAGKSCIILLNYAIMFWYCPRAINAVWINASPSFDECFSLTDISSCSMMRFGTVFQGFLLQRGNLLSKDGDHFSSKRIWSMTLKLNKKNRSTWRIRRGELAFSMSSFYS